MPERVLPPAHHEPQDMPFPAMALSAALLLIGVAALGGVAFWLFPHSASDRVIAEPTPSFAEPRLQPSPRGDMNSFRAEQMLQLNTAYWIDKEHGVVHLPIADAMAKLAAEGDPSWPTAKATAQ